MKCHHHIFFFISFPHPLGKTEEECSFHTLKALFPSRKWATEDTKITVPSSNADDMGTLSFWYATCVLYMTFLYIAIGSSLCHQNSQYCLLVGDRNPCQCIRQEVWYLQLFLWVLYMKMSVSCNKSPAVTHGKLKGHSCTIVLNYK